MIKFEDLHEAEVIKNNDPLEEGRVQIYIPSFMQGWKLDILPWARPWNNAPGGDFGNTTSAMNCVSPTANTKTTTKQFTFGELDIPEEKSVVWVIFAEEEGKKNPFYLTGVQLSASSPGKSFKKTVGSFLSNDIQSVYPDIKFRMDKNGYTKFHSTSIDIRESGEYNSKNSYFYHKENQTTANAFTQISRLVAGDNKFEMKGDEATKVYSIEASTATNSRFKIISDKIQNSNTLEAFADNLVKFKLQSTSSAKSADLNVGSSKITVDDIAGQIEILTSQLLKITVPLTTISGQLNVASPIQAPSMTAPPSPGAPLKLSGTASPGPATDPAVKGIELTVTMGYVTSSLINIVASLGALSSAISSLYGAFLVINPAAILASSSSLGAAATFAGNASSDAGNVTSTLPNALSTNILIN